MSGHRTMGEGRGSLGRLLFVGLALTLSGCDSLLEVENPNNVKEDDLGSATSAAALANGSLATVARAWSLFVLDQGAATDEMKWVGSRDGYQQIDVGNVGNPNNEFIDATWPFATEARFMADEALSRLEKFDADKTLLNRNDLARAYLYAAIIHTAIADHYDDFVISNRREPAPNIGRDKMQRMYDNAIDYANKGLAIVAVTNDAELRLRLTAQRARAHFQKAMWAKVKPSITTQPLVNDANAEADARAFLALTTNTAWRFRFAYSASTVASQWGAWNNERLEFRIGDPYVTPTSDNKKVASVKLMDLIDGTKVAPQLKRDIDELVVARQFPTHTVLSAREMYLILAEIELARGNTAGFATNINAIRTFDGLTAWSASNPAHPTAEAMLRHMRQTNLFLQNRRLMDHYRFKSPSQDWSSGGEATLKPGTFFPIPRIERDANPLIVVG